MKQKLVDIISGAESLSLCADFWTGKDSVGYLGLAVSLLKGSERNDYLIGLRHVEHPHTGPVVKSSIESILSEFGIASLDDPKIISISTDNGSNMVAGLKSCIEIPLHQNGAIDEFLSEGEDSDFEQTEDLFSNIVYKKRIPCTNHILNNNLKYSIKNCENVQNVLRDVKNLIKSLKYIGVVSDYFVKNKLPKFQLPPPTRWQYCSEMVESLLTLKDKMPHICSLGRVDNLTISQYESVESLNSIFKLYSQQIKRFESKLSKLSDAIPAILTLFIELSEHEEQHPEFVSVLRPDLVKRTRCIFDPTSTSFNAIFSLSTYLDPANRKYLGARFNQIDLNALKQNVERIIKRITELGVTEPNKPKAPKLSYGKLDSLLADIPENQDEVFR